MPQAPNRIRTQIDFRPTRGHSDADTLFTVLMHYNRGGSTNMTASQLITTAFMNYDPSEDPDITKIIDVRNKARYFVKKYNISHPRDIKRIAQDESIEIGMDCALLEPDKKFVCFDADDPNVSELWKILDAIRFRDRGCLINIWLYQYFAHGNSDYYNKLCAARLLDWLRREFEFLTEKTAARIEMVSNSIWANAQSEQDFYQEREVTQSQENNDRLRSLMGIRDPRRLMPD